MNAQPTRPQIQARLGALALIPALVCGCTPRPAPAPPPRRPDVRSGASPHARRVPPRRVRPRARPAALRIHDQGVGDLRLGAPIPAAYLRPAAAPATHYQLGFHADAQTWEGFRFPAVPVVVMLKKGPFFRWFEDPKRKGGGVPGPAVRARLARDAVALARRGAPIAWIVIQRPGPQTAKGIGVGSTWADVTQAYGPLKLRPNPPDFGRDRCAVRLAPLSSVWAYFATCAAARAGRPITRLAVWTSLALKDKP